MTAPSITALIGSVEIFHRVYSTTLLVLSPLQYDQPSNRTRIYVHHALSQSDDHLLIRQPLVHITI